MIIAFSGIHGSGKSTQAKVVQKFLSSKKRQVKLISLQNLSIFELAKKLVGLKKPKKTSKPVEYNNIRILTVLRLFTYFLDVLFFDILYYLIYNSKKRIYIFDRYFYDKMANFNLHNKPLYAYFIIYSLFIPKPKLNFLLDIPGKMAHKRKPEYSLDYFMSMDKSYQVMKNRIDFIIIEENSIEETNNKIIKHLNV